MCYEDDVLYPFCNGTSNTSIDILPQVVSRPDHVDGAPVDLDNPLTVQFIPGKQKQLPHKQAYDILGNVINTVFTVQIITEQPQLMFTSTLSQSTLLILQLFYMAFL